MTQGKLAHLLAAGYGSGRDEGYRAWIRVRRKLSSPVSNLHCMTSPVYARALNLLSGLEHAAANVALWLQCNEIREQHPFWPWDHPHPGRGRHPDLDKNFQVAPGLLEIAKSAGIKHGVYPGTNVPFVATIDFTLSIGSWANSTFVHWSCKPWKILSDSASRGRILERIEMERLYSEAIGARHVVVDGRLFSAQLIGQLDWFRPLRSEMLNPAIVGPMRAFSEHFMSVAEDSLTAAKQFAAQKTGTPEHLVDVIFRTAAWLGHIDLDFSRPIVMSRPLKRDYRGFKSSLSAALLGVEHA